MEVGRSLPSGWVADRWMARGFVTFEEFWKTHEAKIASRCYCVRPNHRRHWSVRWVFNLRDWLSHRWFGYSKPGYVSPHDQARVIFELTKAALEREER